MAITADDAERHFKFVCDHPHAHAAKKRFCEFHNGFEKKSSQLQCKHLITSNMPFPSKNDTRLHRRETTHVTK